MSVQEEKEFTKQALKIAIESKLKKQMMYQKRNEQQPLLMRNDISQITVNTSSLPQLNGNKGLSKNKSQSMSKINFDDSQENEAHKAAQFPQTTAHHQPKKDETTAKFFITEDDYLSMNNLHKEVEIVKNSPKINQKDKVLKNFEQDVQNTSLVLQKSKIFKDKSGFFNPLPSFQTKLKPSEDISASQQKIPTTSKYSLILPQLKQNMATHSTKELRILDNQYSEMRKTLDNLYSDK